MNPATVMRRKRSKKEITDILSRYRDSGKNRRQFCEEEGLSYNTLCNWLRVCRRKGEKKTAGSRSVFVSLAVSAQRTGEPVMELRLPDGSSLSFYTLPDSGFLKSLLKG